jgi:hypothetical protein
MQVTIDPRFCGPAGSANGGYTAGILAGALGAAPAEVTLRRPPPLGRALELVRGDERVELRDGELLVAEAAPGEVELEPPAAVGLDEAQRAARRYPGLVRHAFPTCFVCGPERREHDGLRIFAGPVDGRGVVAAPWTPDTTLADADGRVRAEFVWAALDCPGAIAVGYPERGETLLGRIAARTLSLPRVGEPHVVIGWPLGEDGRKLYAGTALFSAAGELRALARATWIAPPG